jgi:hypothetical protein
VRRSLAFLRRRHALDFDAFEHPEQTEHLTRALAGGVTTFAAQHIRLAALKDFSAQRSILNCPCGARASRPSSANSPCAYLITLSFAVPCGVSIDRLLRPRPESCRPGGRPDAGDLDAGQRQTRFDDNVLDRQGSRHQVERHLAMTRLAAAAADLVECGLDLGGRTVLDVETEAEPSAACEQRKRDQADQDSSHAVSSSCWLRAGQPAIFAIACVVQGKLWFSNV